GSPHGGLGARTAVASVPSPVEVAAGAWPARGVTFTFRSTSPTTITAATPINWSNRLRMAQLRGRPCLHPDRISVKDLSAREDPETLRPQQTRRGNRLRVLRFLCISRLGPAPAEAALRHVFAFDLPSDPNP